MASKEFEKGRKDGHNYVDYERKKCTINVIVDAIAGHPYYKPGKNDPDQYKQGHEQGRKDKGRKGW